MTSSTISVNFNDYEQKTVFTATEKCILKLSSSGRDTSNNTQATFRLNSTDIGDYDNYSGAFTDVSRSLANILVPMGIAGSSNSNPTALILYLEEGDTVYATRSGYAFTLTLYSAVFTF